MYAYSVRTSTVSAPCQLLIVSLVGMSACGPPSAAPTPVMRTLDETRTRSLITEAIRGAGYRPAPPREHPLPGARKLRADIRIDGTPYGIAYVTKAEATVLDTSLPAYQADAEQLRLLRPSEGAIVLVLYAQAYRYDIGQTHATNVTTAENKLKRDVSDFVHHVVKPGKHR